MSIYTHLQPRNIDLLRVSIYPSASAGADIGNGISPHRIWDMLPTRQYLSIRPFSRRYRTWEYWMLPHVSIYLSPFPARNMGYGICPLRGSIHLSAPAARDLGYGRLPHVSTYLSPFPARNIGYGGCGIWPRVSF